MGIPARVNRPTVLHAAQPTTAGVARYVAALAADQLHRGWRVTVACPPDGQLAAILGRHGVPRLHWPATRSPGMGTVPETQRLHRLILATQPDVVHLHSSKAGLAGRLAIRGSRPTLFQPHGWSWLAVGGAAARAALRWERLAARWTDLLVCVGEGEAADVPCQRLRSRHVVVRNGVDLSTFTPASERDRQEARDRLGVDRRAPLAVCLGRVTPQKGQDVLLAAWHRVRQQCPAARLCIVGDGELLPALRRRAVAGVRFEPPVDDPRPWYAAADVVVLPSRWEGLSLTLLEALASGRCVVASDIAGLSEAVPAGAGARVPVGDAPALATAVTLRLSDPTRRAGEEGLAALAAPAFDARRTYDHLATVTAQLASSGSYRPPA